MKIGFIGLGRMGSSIVRNLLEKGHEVVVYDQKAEQIENLTAVGAIGASSLEAIGSLLEPPRVVWLMIPAGPAVDNVIDKIAPSLAKDGIIIDGGNSFFKDSIRRASKLFKRTGIQFLDVGTSGGIEGARHGASLTIGGEKGVFEQIIPLFEALAAPGGFSYVGPSGAGHFTKMVHNGIEYAMLEAYGEGFELLSKAPLKIDIIPAIKAWINGGVIRSWILELAERALQKDPKLESVSASIGGGETGEWTVETSIGYDVPIPVIYMALAMRYRSRQVDSLSARLISALRYEFGRHRQ
ncbi:MAG: decarboxylating 6-phosphogluconate dehydrogenase [Actinobacteria bacterium]|nr:decarboxylating 6-phosphogluconate dehydrogenase [Actinomycetota bacterium]